MPLGRREKLADLILHYSHLTLRTGLADPIRACAKTGGPSAESWRGARGDRRDRMRIIATTVDRFAAGENSNRRLRKCCRVYLVDGLVETPGQVGFARGARRLRTAGRRS